MPHPADSSLASDPRVAAVRRTGLLDTPPEAAFDRLTRLASALLRAPMALVSLVDEGRDFVKSHVGLPEPWATSRVIDLAPTFCQVVVGRDAPVAVEDASASAEFACFPAVAGIGVRAYLGMPLRSADGHALGSLCVIDVVPRDWSAAEREALSDLAAAATTELGLRAEIAERRRAEAALRRSEARLAEAQRVGRIGSWELDLATGTVHWSTELFRLVGLEPRGGAITLDDFYATVHPDDRVAFAEMLARQLAARTPYEFMYRTRHPDGTVRHLCGRGEPVLADDGTLVRLVGTAHDLTEQVELEAQLRQAQKMEAVGRLAGGVAHDFNNLLMVIGSHARFALDALPPASPVREEIEAIDEASRRAATLTRQLLAFSRKQILKPEVLELNAVVRGLEPMLRRLIGEDITVHSQLAPRLDMVLADPAQLEQVLVNLALNARDAMSAGGRLTIETANVDVCPTGAVAGPQPGDEPLPAGPYVRLTVRDTGAGMSAETQARAFEPFFTTKETGKGTGLGLATVYGIVRQSGGAVRVASAPGEGTTFEIDLPRAAACPANGSDGAEAAVAGAGTETVMLVEDEPQVRAIVRRLLARRGYTVLEAADGHEALRIAADAAAPTIDLVVTDMVMPEMSGRDFADRLAVRRPGVRVLFMSGYTDDEIIRRGLLRPGMAFLEKPFSSDRLLAAVRAALELHA